MYRDTANVEQEMYDFTGKDWSQWESNKRYIGSHTGRTFNRFTIKDICTWNSTHNTESAAV